MKKFTHNWNQQFISNTRDIKNLDLCLEIGCFEGLTSNYIADHLLSDSGKLICVDPLKDVYIEGDLDNDDEESNKKEFSFFGGQFQRFIDNTEEKITEEKIILHRETSFSFYEKYSPEYLNKFDFIYIDGDHRPDPVYRDAVNCFSLCKGGGLILFDDYEWREQTPHKSTKIGIDKFLSEFSGKYDIIKQNYQILIQKIIQ
jgi:predicted O-methyltransferase YrrM